MHLHAASGAHRVPRQVTSRYLDRIAPRTLEIVERETDLLISCVRDLNRQARAFVLNYRRDIEEYIRDHPEFAAWKGLPTGELWSTLGEDWAIGAGDG